MITKRCRLGWPLAAVLALASCSSQPPAAEKKSEPPPEAITGETALYRMYSMARSSWSHDLEVVRMSSMRLSGVPDASPGKAFAWQAVFAAPGTHNARSYTYSAIEQLPDIHKGAFAGPEQSLSGETFRIEAVKTDSDAAYQTALEKAAKDAQRNQGKPITILLEKERRYPDPAWRVVWGESVSTANLSVFVDSTSGAYLNTMH